LYDHFYIFILDIFFKVDFLGVMLIGLTNLFVSFTLTIIVALRARRVRFAQWKPLAKLVMIKPISGLPMVIRP
jgi:site-specific recombinase